MEFPAPLNKLSEIERMILEKYIEIVEFEKNSEIFSASEETDGCYIIDEGLVRIESEKESNDPDDQFDVLAYVEEGTFLGELSLLHHLPRSASAYTHEKKSELSHAESLSPNLKHSFRNSYKLASTSFQH